MMRFKFIRHPTRFYARDAQEVFYQIDESVIGKNNTIDNFFHPEIDGTVRTFEHQGAVAFDGGEQSRIKTCYYSIMTGLYKNKKSRLFLQDKNPDIKVVLNKNRLF